jgi:hypothetical protein
MRGLTVPVCLAAILGAAAPAAADAVVERLSRSGGFAGVGGFESRAVTTTSAAAQRDESSFRFTGSFLGALQRMAGAGDTVRIVRLDRDLVWTLDPEKRTYTEAPLTAAGERERRTPTSGPPRPERREPSDLTVTRNELTVRATGERRTINDFPCQQYLATWVLEARHHKTGETTRSTMTRDIWTTPETAAIRAVQAEETAYARAYLDKLRLEMPPADAQRYGLHVLAGSLGLDEAEQRKLMAQLRAELAKIEGYEIAAQTDWRLESEGGAAAPGGAAGGTPAPTPTDLGSALGRLFGGPARAGDGGQPGQKPPLFSLYTEVKGLRLVPAQAYEVPAGFTRK